MKKRETVHFIIKVRNQLKMKHATKLIFMSSTNNMSIYRTIMFDNSADVEAYLEKLGCEPEKVSKLSLQNIE